jgi:hypothetical protein
LALGYEDLNDHDLLRQDPLSAVMAGKAEPGTDLLAGKSTLNRMELGTGTPSRYKKITFWRDSVDELLVDVFLEAHPVAPAQIVLDIDTTDIALHSRQEPPRQRSVSSGEPRPLPSVSLPSPVLLPFTPLVKAGSATWPPPRRRAPEALDLR